MNQYNLAGQLDTTMCRTSSRLLVMPLSLSSTTNSLKKRHLTVRELVGAVDGHKFLAADSALHNLAACLSLASIS